MSPKVSSSSSSSAFTGFFPPSASSGQTQQVKSGNISNRRSFTSNNNNNNNGDNRLLSSRKENVDVLKMSYLAEPLSYNYFMQYLKSSKYPKNVTSRSMLLFMLRKIYVTIMIKQNEEEKEEEEIDMGTGGGLVHDLNEDDEDNEYEKKLNNSQLEAGSSSASSWSHCVDAVRLFGIPLFYHWFNNARQLLTDFDFEANENYGIMEDDEDEENENDAGLNDLEELYYERANAMKANGGVSVSGDDEDKVAPLKSKLLISKQTFKILLRSMSDFRKIEAISKNSMRGKTVQSKTNKKSKVMFRSSC
jgi:hypothetical protein